MQKATNYNLIATIVACGFLLFGSTAYTINGTTEVAEVRHRPWGQNRFVFGTTPTTYRFTGQREESSIGLYYYGARWYDPALGRFIQPDTIVPNPGDAQAFDRYAYVLNNPLRYSDPTGHYSNDEIMDHLGCNDWTCVESMFGSDGQYAGLWGWLYILQQANDGDAIVSSQGRYTTNQTTTAAGVFQRSSAGEIQIIYGNGNISFAEPGAIMSERLFAYAGSSGRTPSGFTYGYYSLQNGNGRQIAGTSSTRQNKYLYIDPQKVFLTGLNIIDPRNKTTC